MQTDKFDIIDTLKKIWHRKNQIAKWAGIGLIIGAIIAFSLPKVYKTEIVVAPEGNSAGSMSNMGMIAGMIGINATGLGSEGISQEIYPRIVKSTPFLLEFYDIKVVKNEPNASPILLRDYLEKEQKQAWWKYIFSFPTTVLGWVRGGDEDQLGSDLEKNVNPYVLESSKKSFISSLSTMVEVKTDKEAKTIVVSSSFQDPMIAAIMADSVFNKLQQYMINYRTSKVRHDLSVTQNALVEAKIAYQNAEETYAKAEDRNQNLISKSAKIKVDQLENERDIAFTIYQQVASQLETTKLKLQEETPIATVIEPAKLNAIPVSPNKKMIIAGCAFIFAFAYLGLIFAKDVINQR